MTTNRPVRAGLLLCIALTLLQCAERHAAETFTGKVVAFSDRDTMSVIREGKAVKVRLPGIDFPEKAQPFGTEAKQFTSDADSRRP